MTRGTRVKTTFPVTTHRASDGTFEMGERTVQGVVTAAAGPAVVIMPATRLETPVDTKKQHPD